MVAMNVYCKMPFGQFHARNPVLIELAGRMGRSPSSPAMNSATSLRSILSTKRGA